MRQSPSNINMEIIQLLAALNSGFLTDKLLTKKRSQAAGTVLGDSFVCVGTSAHDNTQSNENI